MHDFSVVWTETHDTVEDLNCWQNSGLPHSGSWQICATFQVVRFLVIMLFCLCTWQNKQTHINKQHFSLQIPLPQRPTQRTCPHPSASNWPRRDYHHGNNKWEELHPTAKNRGHCSPRNKPSYPRTNCVWNLHYTSEPLTSTRHLHTLTTAATY